MSPRADKGRHGRNFAQPGRIAWNIALREMLIGNNPMLRVVGIPNTSEFVRLGMSTLFVRDFMKTQNAASLSQVQLDTDHSIAIARRLIDGAIDIACIFENPLIDPAIEPFLVDSFEDRLVWVHARDFALSAERPIPVLTWPGDEWTVRALSAEGLSFRIVMSTTDYYTKQIAVESGIGLTAVPCRMVPASLMIADAIYLPELPTLKVLLYQRPEARSAAADRLRALLTSLFFDGDTIGGKKFATPN